MTERFRNAQSLVFRNDQAVAMVTVVAPEIVRVRVSPTKAFGRDHSYAVVERDFGEPGASFQIGSSQSVVATRALRVTVTPR